jgi:hypothetical protein
MVKSLDQVQQEPASDEKDEELFSQSMGSPNDFAET